MALVHCRCSKVRLSVGASSWENPLEMTGSYSGAPLLRMSMATPRSTTRALRATFEKRPRPPLEIYMFDIAWYSGLWFFGEAVGIPGVAFGSWWGLVGSFSGSLGSLWDPYKP